MDSINPDTTDERIRLKPSVHAHLERLRKSYPLFGSVPSQSQIVSLALKSLEKDMERMKRRKEKQP